MAIQTFRFVTKGDASSKKAALVITASQSAEWIYVLAVRFYEAKNYAKALRLMEYLLRTQPPPN